MRKVGRNGVKVGGVNYYHEALFEFVGRDVRVYKDLLSAEVVTISVELPIKFLLL